MFKPDYIAVVMRKDKTLPSYKNALINILFRETPANNATGRSHSKYRSTGSGFISKN